jgi:hypothetical protein
MFLKQYINYCAIQLVYSLHFYHHLNTLYLTVLCCAYLPHLLYCDVATPASTAWAHNCTYCHLGLIWRVDNSATFLCQCEEASHTTHTWSQIVKSRYGCSHIMFLACISRESSLQITLLLHQLHMYSYSERNAEIQSINCDGNMCAGLVSAQPWKVEHTSVYDI